MRNQITIAALTFCLSGCVGLTISTNSTEKVSEPTSDSLYRIKSRNIVAKKLPNGTETYVVHEERQWCGLTIWAIIPIPLQLPLCRSFIYVNYTDGKPKQQKEQMLERSGFVCGPLVPVMNTLSTSGKEQSFCATY